VVGDFNARCLSLGDIKNNKLAPYLQDFIDACKLHICNEHAVATRKAKTKERDSILDLSLVSHALEREVSGWGVHEDFSSDHLGVSFLLRLPGQRQQSRKKWKVWNFPEADWTLFRKAVTAELQKWQCQVNWSGELDQLSLSFAEAVIAAAETTIPKKTLTEKARPGLSKKVQKLITARKRAVRVKKRFDTTWVRERIAKLSRQIRSEISSEEQRRVESICDLPPKASLEKIWSRFKKVVRRPRPKIKALKHKGRVLTRGPEIVEAMVEYFANLGADREGESFDEQHRSQTENFLQQQDWKEEEKHEINEPISEQEVANAIKLLDKHKATGPDNVHNRFLIEGGSAIVNAITLLFNESWRRGELPKGWKRAEITPIPKHAAASQVEKLRPISLLSVVGKLMDKIVAARVTTRGEKEEWFLPWQGGFRSGRGVCDQLVAFTHRVAEAWSKRRVCVTAFLDASKAYDRVHRPSVLAKLIRLGLKGRALRWIADFLSDRFACVRYDDVRSRYREFRYGLPQGSCLSPILFNVFLRDVFTPDDLDAAHHIQETNFESKIFDSRIAILHCFWQWYQKCLRTPMKIIDS